MRRDKSVWYPGITVKDAWSSIPQELKEDVYLHVGHILDGNEYKYPAMALARMTSVQREAATIIIDEARKMAGMEIPA